MVSVTQTCRDLGELKSNAQTACRLLFQECYKAGITNIFITETYRSPERQKYLYQQGRTRAGQIVTWTLNSNHSSRLAWDIACSHPSPLYDVLTLTKVGAIARKLGITWGGDWRNNIDRPHFEVKAGWSMPKGNKLEGQVIVPSNSKLKVQLIVEDDAKEAKLMAEARLFNPGSTTLVENAEKYLEQAVSAGIIQGSHLKDLQNGQMNTDRLLGLFITIEQRRMVSATAATYTATGKGEAKALFKRAHEEGIFSVDHSSKVDKMSDGEITSLLAAYINRKV